LKFEWDEEKNEINMVKHGVSFLEAESVFDDENAVVIFNDIHSDYEERFIIIGIDLIFRKLTVCHCYRNNETVIRIISARKASKSEILLYERGGI